MLIIDGTGVLREMFFKMEFVMKNKIIILSLLIGVCGINQMDAMSHQQLDEILQQFVSLQSPDEKREFALKTLRQVYERRSLQALGWYRRIDRIGLGLALWRALSPEDRDMFANEVLSATLQGGIKGLKTLNWERDGCGPILLRGGLFEEHRHVFTKKVLLEVFDDGGVNALKNLGWWEAESLGRILFKGLSDKDSNKLSEEILELTLSNGIDELKGLGWWEYELGDNLFRGLSEESKMFFVDEVLIHALRANTEAFKKLGWWNGDLGHSLLSGLSVENRNYIVKMGVLSIILDGTWFDLNESDDSMISCLNMYLKSSLLKTDSFYEIFKILMKKQFSELTFENASKIIAEAYSVGFSKERIKPFCIRYLTSTQLPKPEEVSLVYFADLFLPLLEKREHSKAPELCEGLPQKIRDFYNVYMALGDVHSAL